MRVGRAGTLLALACTVALAPLAASAFARGSTTRVNLGGGGAQANDYSYAAAISPNGRLVALLSDATNLGGTDDGLNRDLFVRDTVANTTRRITGVAGGSLNGACYNPSFNGDGRYIVFDSPANNVMLGDTNGLRDVFVRDLSTGSTSRVSVANGGGAANGDSIAGGISADGRYVVFGSGATNLALADGNGAFDVFRHDRNTGITMRVSVSTGGVEANAEARLSCISADGRYVGFISQASNLVAGDTNGARDAFVYDTWTAGTERVSLSNVGGQLSDPTDTMEISRDGRFVAFTTWADNVGAPDSNGRPDVYVRDRFANTTRLVSGNIAGVAGTSDSSLTSISSDGRYVGFSSSAVDLVPGDTNSQPDAFVRDMLLGTTQRVSVSGSGAQANGFCSESLVAANGRAVAFSSGAWNLVAGDTNGQDDVFVRNPLGPPAYPSLAGLNRYETAAKASAKAFPAGASCIVIATGENWPDGLSGAGLAGAARGPLLLSGRGALPPATIAEIARLHATSAYVLGGTGALSSAVESKLNALLSGPVKRLAGSTRYETSKKIADETIALQGMKSSRVLIVATGANFPDALAASPIAAAQRAPIVLVAPGGETYLAGQPIKTAIIAGGTKAVYASTESDLKSHVGAAGVIRLYGENRYETAAKLAAYGTTGMLRWDGVTIATGESFADALAGGRMAGALGAPLLLTPRASLSAYTKNALAAHKHEIGTVHFLGGTGALSNTVRNAAKAALP